MWLFNGSNDGSKNASSFVIEKLEKVDKNQSNIIKEKCD